MCINFHKMNILKGKISSLCHLIQNHITLPLRMLEGYNTSNQTIPASWVGTFAYKVTKHICDMTWTNFRSSTNFPSALYQMRAVKSQASRILDHHSISLFPLSRYIFLSSRAARGTFAQIYLSFFCPFSGIPSAHTGCICTLCILSETDQLLNLKTIFSLSR